MTHYAPKAGYPPQTDITTDCAIFSKRHALPPEKDEARHRHQQLPSLALT